jgi:hypothetical protein
VKPRSLSTVTAILGLILLLCVKQLGAQELASSSLMQRGKDLRTALEKTYAGHDSHFGGGLHGTDVTAAVLPFIPPGTPFADAETILRDAGFTIEPYPDVTAPPNPNRAKDWYAVLARIDPFATFLIGKATVYVSLLPPAPGDYTQVSSLSATFFVSMP